MLSTVAWGNFLRKLLNNITSCSSSPRLRCGQLAVGDARLRSPMMGDGHTSGTSSALFENGPVKAQVF